MLGAIRSRAVTVLFALATVAACSTGGTVQNASPTERSTSPITASPLEDGLRLDQIQTIGTHNSFHVAADPAERRLLAAIDPDEAAKREYGHRRIEEQLQDERVRQLELDVFVDTKGGLYADPALRRQAGLGPYDVAAMARPGIKVLHEQDIDYHSVCPTLILCLTELERWSGQHRRHVPVAVHIQLKDGPLIFPIEGQAVPEKWDADQMDALDAEIRSIFPGERLITPDDVRGGMPTLNQAVRAKAWPTLGESRGKVMFFMVNADDYRTTYLAGHPGLEGRVLFTNAPPGEPDAAYVGTDDPIDEGDRIRALAAQGYMVRTRADEPGVEAKAGDSRRLEAALASGAQWVATDHPGPDGARPQYGTDYVAELPGFRSARCNPVTAPPDCRDVGVEPP